MADWSMLPCDILAEIALKLDELEDFILFSAVCHSWNNAITLVKRQWNAKTGMPWLLLPENTNNNPDCLRKIYNLNNNKCYQLKLSETFGARCWGSNYGWVVMETLDHQVLLFNPLTKDWITSLPSIEPLSHEYPKWKFVQRFVVLKMPQSDPPLNGCHDNLLVAMIHGETFLAFACPGNLAWTEVDCYVFDVVCWGDLIYIVDPIGGLRYCNIKGIRDFKNLKFVDYVPGPKPKLRYYGGDACYLLKLDGDIVMVVREKDELIEGEDDESDTEDENEDETNDPLEVDDANDANILPAFHCRTTGFKVYRLNTKRKKWVKINNIGNFSIFVGIDSSLAVPVSTANNYKRNSIYFTDDTIKYRDSRFGGIDMGVYDMGTREITNFYQSDDDLHSYFGPPNFLVPNG